MKVKLTSNQLDAVAKYLADISKLVFAASVLGFFLPTGDTPVTVTTFVMGSVVALTTFVSGIYLVK